MKLNGLWKIKNGAVAICMVLLVTSCVNTAESVDSSNALPQTESAEETTGTSTLRLSAPQLKDLASDDIGLLMRIHYATHTVDFDRARAFYRTLGYTEGVTGFPLTNTHQMARSLGMFDECQYELAKGEVMSMPGAASPNSIDLLQFKTPFNDEPPYEKPNHLGAAYAVFATSDFAADFATLTSMNTQFLAPPATDKNGRFVFFRDPDGVLYRLQESFSQAPPTGSMNIFDMPYVAINVSDLEKSLAFYRRLGYVTNGEPEVYASSVAEANAHGLAEAFEVRQVDIKIARGDQHRLRLTQWLSPVDLDPPYAPPINHIGINRIAVLVSHLDRAVKILQEEGVPFLSEVAPCCTGTGEDETGIVHAIDPDGVFIELVGAIEKREPLPHPEHCPPMEIKYPEDAS